MQSPAEHPDPVGSCSPVHYESRSNQKCDVLLPPSQSLYFWDKNRILTRVSCWWSFWQVYHSDLLCFQYIYPKHIKNKIVTVLLSKAYIYIYMPYLTRLWLFYFIYIYIYIYIYIGIYKQWPKDIFAKMCLKISIFGLFFFFFVSKDTLY